MADTLHHSSTHLPIPAEFVVPTPHRPTLSEPSSTLPRGVGQNYQPIYVTPSGAYYTPPLPIRPTTPISPPIDANGVPRRPTSPWAPLLDIGHVRTQSPAPMTLAPQPCCDVDVPSALRIPFPMPSPSSSMSPSSCFSMDDETQTTSSQSSLPVTPYDHEEFPLPSCCPGKILPGEPFVEEPENIDHCCSDEATCKRSQSLTQRKGVAQQAHAMLWGPLSNMSRSVSS